MDAPHEASPSDVETQTVHPRRLGALLVVAAVAYALDQVTKVVAVDRLTGRDPVELLGGLLTLRLIRNPGAAFGLAGGATVVFSIVAVVVAVMILRTARHLRSVPWAIALGLLLGGAVGNLTDRVVRTPGVLRGHVVDFLELPNWPVFNVADMAICGGAALIVVLTLLGRTIEGTVERG
jgi:signal peptidase II